MQTNFLFLLGHPGSGASALYESLSSSPAVAGDRGLDEKQFYNVGHLDKLADRGRLSRERARWFADVLTEDSSFVARHLYPCCKFVVVVREPDGALASAVAAGDPNPRSLPTRYCSRLVRLCEIARDAPGTMLATYDEVADGTALRGLRARLGLGHVGNAFRAEDVPRLRDSHQLAGCRAKYARCLEYLRARCVPARV
jgi:hypothetical protein